MYKKKRVLVTAIGTQNTTAVVQMLKKAKDQYYVIGADINHEKSVVTSREVDEFFQFPLAIPNTPKYVDFLLTFCKEHCVDYIFAAIDEEVQELRNRENDFFKNGTILCLPNKETVTLCHYKNLFSNWMKEHLPEYAIRTYTKIDDIKSYPVFVKPIEGRASSGCTAIQTKEQLESLYPRWDNIVVQDYIAGDIIVADVVCNPQYNQYEIVQRKELLRNEHGCGIAVEIINNLDVEKACLKLAKKMGIEGVVNVECFVEDSEVRIIEVNPRMPAGTMYTCLAGINTVQEAINIADGMPCIGGSVKVGTRYARRYETYEM